jgi:hypothetical protein
VKKTKKTVFIKSRAVEFAAMAKKYLHGFAFLENDLQLDNVSNLTEAEPREDEYSEITYFDSSFDRYCMADSGSQPTSPSRSTLREVRCTSPPYAGSPAGATTSSTCLRSSERWRPWRCWSAAQRGT